MAHRHPRVLRDRKLDKFDARVRMRWSAYGRPPRRYSLSWLPGRAPAIMPMANNLLAARGGSKSHLHDYSTVTLTADWGALDGDDISSCTRPAVRKSSAEDQETHRWPGE